MLLNVRYDYEPGCCVWPIPFAFGSPRDIGVSLLDDAGVERKLVLDRDYIIKDASVITFIPEGFRLSICLISPVDLRANAARVLSGEARTVEVAQPVLQQEPVQIVQTDTLQVQALEQRLASIEEEQAQALVLARKIEADSQVQAIRNAADAGIADVRQAMTETLDTLAARSSDAATAIRILESNVVDAASLLDESVKTAKETSANVDMACNAALARLERRVAELEAQLASREAAGISSLAEAATQSRTLIADAQAEAVRTAAEASRMAGQSFVESGYRVVVEGTQANMVLPLPGGLAYWPGRNALFIARNGFLLTPGLDFEETGASDSLSTSVLYHLPLAPNDVLSFHIIPTNPGQDAAASARQAAQSASACAISEGRCRTAEATVQSLVDRVTLDGEKKLTEIEQRGSEAAHNIRSLRDESIARIEDVARRSRTSSASLWSEAEDNIKKLSQSTDTALRKLAFDSQETIKSVRMECQAKAEAAATKAEGEKTISQSLTDQVRALAATAWQAAMQASMDAARPGIAAVTSIEELAFHVSGVYVVNSLLHSHTHFMGVWPVEDLEAANFDGLFFIGKPYPDSPALPTLPYPEEPSLVPEMQPAASATEWLPCGHDHS